MSRVRLEEEPVKAPSKRQRLELEEAPPPTKRIRLALEPDPVPVVEPGASQGAQTAIQEPQLVAKEEPVKPEVKPFISTEDHNVFYVPAEGLEVEGVRLEPGWYFWDETGGLGGGVYQTEAQAVEAINAYAESLDRSDDHAPENQAEAALGHLRLEETKPINEVKDLVVPITIDGTPVPPKAPDMAVVRSQAGIDIGVHAPTEAKEPELTPEQKNDVEQMVIAAIEAPKVEQSTTAIPPPEPAPLFKPGDQIKVGKPTGVSSRYWGRSGEVLAVVTNCYPWSYSVKAHGRDIQLAEADMRKK